MESKRNLIMYEGYFVKVRVLFVALDFNKLPSSCLIEYEQNDIAFLYEPEYEIAFGLYFQYLFQPLEDTI